MNIIQTAEAEAARAVALGRRLGAAVERSESSYLPVDTLRRLASGDVFDPLIADPIADLITDAVRDLRSSTRRPEPGLSSISWRADRRTACTASCERCMSLRRSTR
ncbi:hypothetical protein DDV93_14105 [Cereibacter johrii]|nr:hypothetical protein DDV93_14105 [Cereibacter johrii]